MHFLGENRIDLNGDLNGDFPNDAVTFCFFCSGDFSVTSLLFDILLNGDVVTNETLRLFNLCKVRFDLFLPIIVHSKNLKNTKDILFKD